MDRESHPQELNRVIISLCVSKCHLSLSPAEEAAVNSGSFVSPRGHGAHQGVEGRAVREMIPGNQEPGLASVLQTGPHAVTSE